MSEITFRQATLEKDFDQCFEIHYEAFKDYPIFNIYTANTPEQQENFNKSLMNVQLNESFKNDIVFVAEKGNEMVGVALFQNPEHKEPNIFQYLYSSGIAMIRHIWYGGFKNTFGFLDMVDKCNAPLMEYSEKHPTWTLESISVKRKYFRQGIGSRMINECIIPYIKENNGNCLMLVTNTEGHTLFYKKNKFELFNKTEFICNNQLVKNWVFKRDI